MTDTSVDKSQDAGLPEHSDPEAMHDIIARLEAIKEPWNRKSRDEGVTLLKELVEKTEFYEIQVEIWDKVQSGFKVAQAEDYVRQRIISAEREYREEVKRIQDELESKQAETAEYEGRINQSIDKLSALHAQIEDLRREILLDYTKVSEYYNPATSAVELRDELTQIQHKISTFGGVGTAVMVAPQDFTVKGEHLGVEYQENVAGLLLNAYNQEVENTIVALDASQTIQGAMTRLQNAHRKAVDLGEAFGITFSDEYHQLRLREIDLTFQYHMKADQEKEQEKKHRVILREQREKQEEARIALEGIADEMVALKTQYQTRVAELMLNKPDGSPAPSPEEDEVLQRLRTRGEELNARRGRIKTAEERMKIGYLYVISNVGSFGENVVKIGVTQSDKPDAYIRAMNNPAIPFEYDTHLLHFDENATELQKAVALRLQGRELNKVSADKGFYRASTHEVESILMELTDGKIGSFNHAVVASSYHRSQEIDATLSD